MIPQKQSDTPEIEDLQSEADALENKAERDGLIPDSNVDDDGVGPQTGVVP